jgi:hypothetical protein
MRLRNAFAAIVALFLLASSCGAAACDAACMLRSTKSRCHFSQIAPDSPQNSAQITHHHCAAMSGRVSYQTTSACFVSNISGCSHTFCQEPTSFLAPGQNFQPEQVRWLISSPASTPGQPRLVERFARETPPFMAPFHSLLTIALRI